MMLCLIGRDDGVVNSGIGIDITRVVIAILEEAMATPPGRAAGVAGAVTGGAGGAGVVGGAAVASEVSPVYSVVKSKYLISWHA